MSTVRKRTVAQPIFDAEEEKIVVAQPLPQCTPVDVVVDNDDDSIEEIELNVEGDTNIIANEDEFWAYVKDLKWSDAIQNPRANGKVIDHGHKHITDLSPKSFQSFIKYFNLKLTDLDTLLTLRGVFPKLERQLDEQTKKYLLSHIVFRGKTFYKSIIEDPFFIGYLVGKSETSDEFHHATITRAR